MTDIAKYLPMNTIVAFNLVGGQFGSGFPRSRSQSPSKRTMPKSLVLVLLAVLLMCPAISRGEEKTSVTVGVVFGPQTSYREAVQALQKTLASQHGRCVLIELPKSEQRTEQDKVLVQLAEAKPHVIVGVGVQSLTLIRQANLKVPIVFSMVPNILDASFWNEGKNPSSLAGVTTDIAPQEQVGWIKKICPDVKNIGVFFSPRTKKTAESIQKAGKDADIEVTAIQTDRDRVSDSIKDLHERACDAVLMLPDAGIYNSTNVRTLLLWGIRQKKPVFGFSQSIVKAGGFAGQYCAPHEVGKQTAKLIGNILKGTAPDKIGLQYAWPIQRAINERTAELIGITVDEAILKDVTKRFGKDE